MLQLFIALAYHVNCVFAHRFHGLRCPVVTCDSSLCAHITHCTQVGSLVLESLTTKGAAGAAALKVEAAAKAAHLGTEALAQASGG